MIFGRIRQATAWCGLAGAVAIGPGAVAAPAPIYPYVVPVRTDPLMANLAIPANAATQGMWSSTQSWPLVGLHLTVMPDGRILSFGTPVGQGVQDGRTLDIWNPALGFSAGSHFTFPNAQSIDSFCGTAALLPSTGQVLVSGGGSANDGYQSFLSSLVTPSKTSDVSLGFPMASQRWYATMITLADGRQLIAGGGTPYAIPTAYQNPAAAQPNISITPEVFTPTTGWSSLFGATSNDAFGPINNRGWYPRMWVAPDGTVFGVSTEKVWSLNPTKNTITTLGTFKTAVDQNALPNVGPTSTAVMYDTGKILQVGGNGYANGYPSPSSPYATIFDITTPQHFTTTDTAPMHYPRQWANSLVLPTGQVLVTGGSTYADNADPNAVYPAEIWTPTSGTWTLGASAGNYRGYHSATVLLPDGAVLSTGGGVPGPVDNFNAEIYYPPYLFQQASGKSVLAARPQIVSLSSGSVGYGKSLNVQMADTNKVSQASLVGLSTTTHSFNTFQRRIKLTFTQSSAQLTLTAPPSANIAPPGYYLLTVLNTANKPSPGVVVAIGGAPAPVPAVPAAALPQFVNSAGLVQSGQTVTRVSHGADGTTVVINSYDGSLWQMTADYAANPLNAPVQMTDVAVVSAHSIYAVGVDQNIYRFDGSTWTNVGYNVLSVGAASDGTVAIVTTYNTIFRKVADDNVEAWIQISGAAKRVAPMSANSFWTIGLDGNVYRGTAQGNFTQAGVNVRDISTSPDGHVLVVNSATNELWIKSGDNTTAKYTNIPFTATSVAAVNGGGVIAIGTDWNTYRSANVSMH